MTLRQTETAPHWHDSHDDMDQEQALFPRAVTEYYQQKYYDH